MPSRLLTVLGITLEFWLCIGLIPTFPASPTARDFSRSPDAEVKEFRLD